MYPILLLSTTLRVLFTILTLYQIKRTTGCIFQIKTIIQISKSFYFVFEIHRFFFAAFFTGRPTIPFTDFLWPKVRKTSKVRKRSKRFSTIWTTFERFPSTNTLESWTGLFRTIRYRYNPIKYNLTCFSKTNITFIGLKDSYFKQLLLESESTVFGNSFWIN